MGGGGVGGDVEGVGLVGGPGRERWLCIYVTIVLALCVDGDVLA